MRRCPFGMAPMIFSFFRMDWAEVETGESERRGEEDQGFSLTTRTQAQEIPWGRGLIPERRRSGKFAASCSRNGGLPHTFCDLLAHPLEPLSVLPPIHGIPPPPSKHSARMKLNRRHSSLPSVDSAGMCVPICLFLCTISPTLHSSLSPLTLSLPFSGVVNFQLENVVAVGTPRVDSRAYFDHNFMAQTKFGRCKVCLPPPQELPVARRVLRVGCHHVEVQLWCGMRHAPCGGLRPPQRLWWGWRTCRLRSRRAK